MDKAYQHIPLAERIRPQNLEDIVGQSHLTGEQGVFRKMLAQGRVPSIILWGPPGVGKTTLVQLVARYVKAPFYTLSAVSSGVKEVREVIQKASMHSQTILFIDEIHRFNKAQQDALLGAVEKGVITLIGATTENPSFEINTALLSRCQVYVLKPLSTEALQRVVEHAMQNDVVLSQQSIRIQEFDALFYFSGGDARRLLNLLEMVVQSEAPKDTIVIDNTKVEQVAQQKQAFYDKNGDQHYDIISAFIKSMRGSDPNAAVYWLARMIEAGEDPKFIARRMLILASEDIGNANPTALVLATNCFQAVNMIGYPEAEIVLSQTAIYLAASAKSNASYMAIKKARALVKQTGDLPVPFHLRNAPTSLMKKHGYGKGYLYAHDFPHNFVEQEFLPNTLESTMFYEPGTNAKEQSFRERFRKLWHSKYRY